MCKCVARGVDTYSLIPSKVATVALPPGSRLFPETWGASLRHAPSDQLVRVLRVARIPVCEPVRTQGFPAARRFRPAQWEGQFLARDGRRTGSHAIRLCPGRWIVPAAGPTVRPAEGGCVDRRLA